MQPYHSDYYQPYNHYYRAIIENNEHPEKHFKEIIVNKNDCMGLYIECVPHSSGPSASYGATDSFIPTTHKHNTPIIPLEPTFQPNKKPFIMVNFNKTLHTNKPISHDLDEQPQWPWSASIFIDGKLVCIGILLDKYWVLTESSCLSLVNLKFDFVVVVLGGTKPYLKIQGPYEQIIRVNCIVKVDNCNTVLLYLEHKAHYNRHCLPTYLPEV